MKKGLIAVWSAVFLSVMVFASASYGADAKAGKTAYEKNKCGICHGKDGKGTKMGPAVTGKADAKAKTAILKGKGKMKGFESKVGKDIDNLLEYLKGLK